MLYRGLTVDERTDNMTASAKKLTGPMRKSYEWLRARGGDGSFGKGGTTLVAHGEITKANRPHWEALANSGKVEFYDTGRIRIIACLD